MWARTFAWSALFDSRLDSSYKAFGVGVYSLVRCERGLKRGKLCFEYFVKLVPVCFGIVIVIS